MGRKSFSSCAGISLKKVVKIVSAVGKCRKKDCYENTWINGAIEIVKQGILKIVHKGKRVKKVLKNCNIIGYDKIRKLTSIIDISITANGGKQRKNGRECRENSIGLKLIMIIWGALMCSWYLIYSLRSESYHTKVNENDIIGGLEKSAGMHINGNMKIIDEGLLMERSEWYGERLRNAKNWNIKDCEALQWLVFDSDQEAVKKNYMIEEEIVKQEILVTIIALEKFSQITNIDYDTNISKIKIMVEAKWTKEYLQLVEKGIKIAVNDLEFMIEKAADEGWVDDTIDEDNEEFMNNENKENGRN